MKMTQGSTSMGSLTFQGFLTRFFKELTRFPRRKWMRKLWSSILSLSIKRCVCFVYPGIPRGSCFNINAYEKETLDNLSSAFSDVDQPCSNVWMESWILNNALNVEYKLNIERVVDNMIQNYIWNWIEYCYIWLAMKILYKRQILKKWAFQEWLLRPRYCHGVFATWIL